MAHSVLIIEDEILVREFISDYFEKESWTIYEAEDGQEALAIFEKQSIDIVILDVMLPKLDGWSVCRRLRKTSSVPIIMLTARDDEDDKLLGFELGIDDYVTKPFSPRVLVAKAKALLKRSLGDDYMQTALYQFGTLTMNERSRTVSVENQQIELSPKEFDVLLYLMKQKDSVVSREQLLNAVWGYDFFGDARTVDTHIKKLRAKLGAESKRIVTVIRIGYKFEGA